MSVWRKAVAYSCGRSLPKILVIITSPGCRTQRAIVEKIQVGSRFLNFHIVLNNQDSSLTSPGFGCCSGNLANLALFMSP